MTCFWPDHPNQGGALSVNIDWKIGVAAKDWESVARKEKIEVRINFFFPNKNIKDGQGYFRNLTNCHTFW